MDQFYTNNQQSIVASNRILYTPSSFARSSLLHLQEIGELEAKRAHTSSRSGLQSYLFFNIVSGSGSLSYNDKIFSIAEGDCVFIDCQNSYSHLTDLDDLWRLKWIHFYGPNLPAVYKKYKERGGRPVFRPESIEEVEKIWTELMRVARSNDYMRDMLINQYLSEMMVCVMRESWHPEDQESLTTKKSIILPIKNYLDNNYSEKITLDRLASQFYINKYYLTKTFKEQYGQSINSYL